MARGRRTARWITMVGVLLVAVWGLYALFDRLTAAGSGQASTQLILPALSLLVVILALGLAGVLVRNLVRLVVERKHGMLGARLRAKLVFYFLALVLLPALVLFYGSAHVIKESVEAVLRTPLEELTERSGTIVQEWRDYLKAQALDTARSIGREIEHGGYLAPDRGDELRELLDLWRLDLDPRHIRISRGRTTVADVEASSVTLDPKLRAEADRLLEALVLRVAATRRAQSHIDYLGDGLLAHAAVPIGAGDGTEPWVVSVGIVVPPRLTGNLEDIDRAATVYRQFRVQRRELVRLYLTLTGVVFLATLFVATWIGFYVARRITRPIQELADATREIAAGNLNVRVETEAGDELGMLVEAFNDMAAELHESRETITRSTADLRRSNRALEERRRYIETLIAKLSTAVLSLDPQGRVTTANPAVSRILGLTPVVGEDAWSQLRIPGLEPLCEVLDRELPRPGSGVRRELALTRDGAVLHVALQVSPLVGASGEHLGTLLMVEDLTELLRAQRIAAWREVARRIAHEIKNPLTPIQLWAQRLRKKFDDRSEDVGQVVSEATDAIEHEVAALKQLVDEFSLFARLPEVRRREVGLREMLNSALSLYRGLGEIRFEVEVAPDLDQAWIDPDQIRRVLINLIDNAVTAMERQGRLCITAARAPDGTTLRIEVADEGPGIDPADRDKMFSPYYSTKKRGTGLGLAIVHKIVTDHAGTIRVEPNRPRGARFVIELPALEPPLLERAEGASGGR
jgi:two-component system nitrogen regulation sensor histidine kinase NtrY